MSTIRPTRGSPSGSVDRTNSTTTPLGISQSWTGGLTDIWVSVFVQGGGSAVGVDARYKFILVDV